MVIDTEAAGTDAGCWARSDVMDPICGGWSGTGERLLLLCASVPFGRYSVVCGTRMSGWTDDEDEEAEDRLELVATSYAGGPLGSGDTEAAIEGGSGSGLVGFDSLSLPLPLRSSNIVRVYMRVWICRSAR